VPFKSATTVPFAQRCEVVEELRFVFSSLGEKKFSRQIFLRSGQSLHGKKSLPSVFPVRNVWKFLVLQTCGHLHVTKRHSELPDQHGLPAVLETQLEQMESQFAPPNLLPKCTKVVGLTLPPRTRRFVLTPQKTSRVQKK
jgi:hypothetical protein